MAVYAAQIDRMDQGIGRILEQVRRSGAEDDTLVLFLSDNGGCAENVRPEWYDIPSKTRAGAAVRVGNNPAVTPGGETTFQSYGPGWANASNAPFRLYKHWVHEGGISTPLIASWRGGRVRRGAITHEYGHVSDIMASCLEAAGAQYPEAPITPLEGHSLLPVLRGGTRQAPTLGWEHEGNRALRQGKWKLVSRYKQPWELFDMEADRTEQRDLAGADPERVKAMARTWAAWAERCGVLDWWEVQRLPAVG
jgi:arylsulfatase